VKEVGDFKGGNCLICWQNMIANKDNFGADKMETLSRQLLLEWGNKSASVWSKLLHGEY